MHALLRDPPAKGPFKAAFIENKLWAALNASQQALLPNLDAFRSIRTYQVLFSFDLQSCGYHAFKLKERLEKRGGIKPVTANAPLVSKTLATGKAIRDRRPGPDPTTLLGDVIDQAGAATSVAQMKLALDGGRQVHARVLSGVGYGHAAPSPDPRAQPVTLNKPPPEEHSLFIIGYDGNAFVFNDPDASVSHTPEDGFGLLFFDSTANCLSTAQNQADLNVTSDGEHKPSGQRKSSDKRYQVIRLAPF